MKSQVVKDGKCPNCGSNIYGYGYVNNCPMCNAKIIHSVVSPQRHQELLAASMAKLVTKLREGIR